MASLSLADAPMPDGARESVDPVARSEAAFVEHYHFVWRLLRRFGVQAADVDDAAQQVFVTFVRKIEQVELGKERTFLYGTALRIAANERRSCVRRNRPFTELDSHLRSAQPDDLTEASRLRDLLDALLARMPDELRRVLVLAEIEQYQVEEIAMLEGIPTGTAASRLRRARQRFRELLADQNHKNPFARGEP